MNSRRQIPSEKTDMSHSPRRDAFRVAVIAEDLRLPLDEGAKKASFSLICSFKRKGMGPSVFTWYANPALENTFPLPSNKFLVGRSFAHDLKTQAPEAILYMPASSGTIGAFIRAAAIKAQASGVPLALLNLQYRRLPSIGRYLNLPRYADLVFAQSQASADVFRSLGCKTVLLPGGVDHTIFRPASKQEKHSLRLKYGFQDADQIVLHIGHCNRDRNVALLARLAESGLKTILVASTSTSLDYDLLGELRQSGVTVITDFIETIQEFYQLSDCYLFPVFNATSAIDAPLSILEAMACNLPIVTTRFGALPNVFQPGNGLYYGETEEEMICMVKQALTEQDCGTREKVVPYSWDNAALTILDALQEISKP